MRFYLILFCFFIVVPCYEECMFPHIKCETTKKIQMWGYSWYIRVNIGFHGTSMSLEFSLVLNTSGISYVSFSGKKRLLWVLDCHKKNAVITNSNQTTKINHDLSLFLIEIILKVIVLSVIGKIQIYSYLGAINDWTATKTDLPWMQVVLQQAWHSNSSLEISS